MIGTIYMVLNTVNNKKYIGQTIMTLNRRKSSHLLSAKHHYDNLYFHRAINKYGEEAFEWTVLETIKNENKTELSQKLNEREIYYIKLYNTTNPDLGYNMTSGGESYHEQAQDFWSSNRSDEWRKELSRRMTEKWSDKELREQHQNWMNEYYKTEAGIEQAKHHSDFMKDYYNGEQARQNKAKTSKWFVKAISPEKKELIFISSKEPNQYFGRDISLRSHMKNVGDKWIPTKRSPLYGWQFEAIEKYEF